MLAAEEGSKIKELKLPQEYSASSSFGQTREHGDFLPANASTIYQVFEASQSPIQMQHNQTLQQLSSTQKKTIFTK